MGTSLAPLIEEEVCGGEEVIPRTPVPGNIRLKGCFVTVFQNLKGCGDNLQERVYDSPSQNQ